MRLYWHGGAFIYPGYQSSVGYLYCKHLLCVCGCLIASFMECFVIQHFLISLSLDSCIFPFMICAFVFV